MSDAADLIDEADEALFDESGGLTDLPQNPDDGSDAAGDERAPRRRAVSPAAGSKLRGAPSPRSTRGGGAGGKRVTKKESALEELKDDLVSEAAKLSALITPVLPTTGYYLMGDADAAMRGLVDLVKDQPAAVRGLQTVAKAAPGITVGRWVVGGAVAAMVDFRKMNPDSVPARALGVTNAWVATHEKEAGEQGVYVPEPSPVFGDFQPL